MQEKQKTKSEGQKINMATKIVGTLSLFLFFGFNFASAESVVYLKNSSGILVGKISYERTFVNEYIKINSFCAYKNITEGIGCEYVDENSPLAGAGDNAVRLVSPQNLQNNSGIWGAIGKLSGRVDGLFKAVTGQTPTPIIIPEVVQNTSVTTQNQNPVLNSVPVQNTPTPSSQPATNSGGNNSGQTPTQSIVYQVIERAVPGPAGRDGINGTNGKDGQSGYPSVSYFPGTAQFNGPGPLNAVTSGGPASFTIVSGSDGNFTNINATNGTITYATVTDIVGTNASFTNLNVSNINGQSFTGVALAGATLTASITTTIDLIATNATITNSTSTNIFSAFAKFLSSYITTLFGNSSNFVISNASTSNATTSNAVTFNGTTGNFVTENATTNNSQTSNSSTSNATTSNAVTFNGTTGNVGTINSGTGNFGNLNATGTTQLTNVYASTSNASTTNAITGNITNLNNTLATITSATVTDLSVTNFVTPSLNAANGTITNSTSTNIFSTFANLLSAYIATLFGGSSNFITSNASTSNATTSNAVTFNGTTGNITNLNNTLATITNATVTNLSVTNITSPNLNNTNATFTNATTTNLYATNLTSSLLNGYIWRGSTSNLSEATSSLFVSDKGYLGIGNTTPGANLAISQGTLTGASQGALIIDGTWNNAGTIFKGIDLNITNTAAHSNSTLLNLALGGVSVFKVKANGDSIFTGNLGVTGTTTINGGLDMSSQKIINVAAPISGNDVANKSYVDAFVQGISYQEPVISISTTTIVSSTTGSRYIIGAGSSGTGCAFNAIATNVSSGSWTCFTPASGTTAYVDNGTDQSYNFNGSTWVSLGATINHSALIGLQGGTSGEYYHVTAAEFAALNSVNAQLTQLQTTGTATQFVNLTLTGGLNITGGQGATISNATFTNAYISNTASITTGYINDLISNQNATLTNATSTTFYSQLLTALSAIFTSLTATNATFTNATSTNSFATTASSSNLYTSLANIATAFFSTLFASTGNFTILNASTTNASTSNIANLNATNATLTNATATNLYVSGNFTTASPATFSGTTTFATTTHASSTITNLSSNNATINTLANTNFTSTNGTVTNATSTNFFSNILTALTGAFTSLTSTNSTLTNATSTNLNVSNLLTALTAAFTNLIATNATLTNATATNLYAQNASFTNLTATGYFGTSNGVGTNGQILQTTGTTTQWVSTSSLGISGGTDTYSTVSSEGLLVNSAGTQSIPNATYATVTDLTVVTRNDFGASSLSGGVFTVPSGKAGWYQINANYTPNVSNGSVRVHIVVNGTVRHIAGSTGTDNYIDTAFAVYLNAGDIVSISAYQTSGSAQLVYYTTSLSLVRLNFNVYGNSGSSITPSFSVHKNGTNQAGIVVGNQKITWSAKSFDTNTNFDTTTSRYTPTIAGKYLFTTAVESNLAVPATEAWQARIYKNGSSVCDGSTSGSGGGNGASSVATCVLDANGTTDYFEVFLLSSAANSVYGVVSATYFTGSRIDGGSGPFTQASSSFAYSAVSSIAIGTSTYQNANSLYIQNGLTLADQTASSTTNSLYNSGGGLYWNGTSLSNATGTQGFISYFSTTGSSSVATSSIFISTAGNVGIGNTSPTNKLDITGNLNVADTYAYKYNGANVIRASTTLNNYFFGNSGNLTMTGSNVSAFGHTALLNNTTGSDNSAFGSFALTANTTGLENAANGHGSLNANTTGSYNTANGSQSLFLNTTSNANVANGFQALYNNTAASNTAIGYQSMFTNTTGTTNTANGYQALYSNTTGASTTAVGYQALFSNTTGLRNTGIGDSALYANTIGFSNTAVGSNAMLINTTGDRNTAIGRKALQENTTGVQNTAAGESALIVNTTGTQNSAFGSTVLTSNTTGTFNTGVGYQALVASISGSNNTSVGYFSGASLTTGSNNTFIGYNAQPSAVGVSDEVRIGGTNVTSFRAQVALTVTSDSRFKENIATTSLGLDFLTKLKPVQYTRIADNEHKVEYGFIAQEVLEQLTAFNATNTGLIAESSNASGTPFLSLRYNDFISILTLSVQEVANITGTFKTNLINWLANADNGINKFFAKSIYSQLVCLTDDSTDANPVCVTKAELLQIKSGNSLPGVQTIIPPITSATPTSPVVTMVGSSTMSMTVGEIYIELGATVTDDLDTGLTINISGSVDAALAGTYYVVYSSNPDTQGNLSNTATRTVIVADALVVPPSIIPPTCTASTTLNTITNTCE